MDAAAIKMENFTERVVWSGLELLSLEVSCFPHAYFEHDTK